MGFFRIISFFLRAIEDAVEKNYIPVVDRQTIKNVFFPAEKDVNTWECFFKQPLGYSMRDIPNVKDADIYINNIASVVSPVSIMHCQDADIVNYWRKIAGKYISFKKEVLCLLEEKRSKLLFGKRVLGVSVREGYIKLSENEPNKIVGHPIQTGIDEMVELTSKYMVEWECDYVFVACQTQDTITKFKNKFGDRCLYCEKDRPSYEGLPEGTQLLNMKKDNAYKREMDYVTEIYLLSKCTSFLCSENSGSEAAFIMSEGFEKFMCLNKGIY